jgi:DNA-binding NarL/FixJ family response regulator
MSEKIRVVVADDEPGYRNALSKILSHAADIELVGTAKDGMEALDLCVNEDADVLLTDIDMPRMNGIETIRALGRKKLDAVPVVLSVHEDSESVFDAIRAGAVGYLLKTSNSDDVLQAIRRAAKGETSLTPKIATMVIQDFRRQKEDRGLPEDHLYDLSPRELEILQMVSEGLRNKEIADRLVLAEKTVKNHVSNILKALHVNSRTEAAMKAVKENLVGG